MGTHPAAALKLRRHIVNVLARLWFSEPTAGLDGIAALGRHREGGPTQTINHGANFLGASLNLANTDR